MDLYRDIILDHYKYPRNYGHLDHPDAVAEEYNTTCGDRIRMEIKFKKAQGGSRTISEITFTGDGCSISKAAASLLTETAKNKTAPQLLLMTYEDIVRLLGTTLTVSRIKCALLPLEVLQKALQT
ncbi:hypothetical protein A2154_05055 [Candidatus Gottesmanbacteria bacterium RBG_16_43_7]|uniref:NIF system FeS cluster assembly NifU N-terminal domain-containing protein n=1 Tax=Candidatus Gottesmanbacteria bacterium RBG_16_43_7 TaxID=1798373 RepID=A0A1F5Z877_9BACT|nr:MAG: hypothetical protein A2154_05055 [Candidatus Gottesmanbacteria bacterium RBG_16_43_7]